MEILTDYIVVAVMAICMATGYIIKYSLDFIPNKYIPLIMGTLGIVLNIWASAWSVNPDIVLGGICSGLAATGAYEAAKSIGK